MAQKPAAGTPAVLAVPRGWAEWGRRLEQACAPMPARIKVVTQSPFPGWDSYKIPEPLAGAGATIPIPSLPE